MFNASNCPESHPLGLPGNSYSALTEIDLDIMISPPKAGTVVIYHKKLTFFLPFFPYFVFFFLSFLFFFAITSDLNPWSMHSRQALYQPSSIPCPPFNFLK